MATAASSSSSEPSLETPQWLKTLPLAPEFHPTIAEFQDPISYILKIEKQASNYGICKIVPPLPPQPKKTLLSNLNRSLSARNPNSQPTFTTRHQQIGFCPRRPRPVQRPVWQSGENYTIQEFEAKAKQFEKIHLKRSGKKGVSALEIETLFWKASADKPFTVEYANDMPGSGFAPVNPKKWRETGEGVTVGETAWNMRGVSRSNGSLLRFMKDEIPGVTSPMVYIAMLFSWFAWHVEDHDLHSLNYMHMGAAKTWYGVPRDARLAFEDVIRVHGYGGEINQLVTFATLGEKTTVMSPEVLIGAGIPCCRLVQNVGEFVVTFPGAYHTGFSHGFNCAEASNIATPEWLRFAKEAAIRRASINYPPMVSHFQLLYALALTLCSRVPLSSSPKPRSSRLKEKRRGEGENVVKDLFVRDVIKNNDLLHILLNQGSCVLVPQNFSRISASLDIRAGSHREVKSRLPLRCHNDESQDAPGDLAYDDNMLERHVKLGHLTGVRSVCGRSMFDRDRLATSSVRHDQRESDKLCNLSSVTVKPDGEKENTSQGANLLQQELFSCVTCGILSYACAAVIQPREATVRCLMSSNGNFFNDWNDGSRDQYLITNGKKYTSDTNYDSKIIDTSCQDGLYDVPVQSGEYQIQVADQNYEAQEADQNYEVQVVELSHEVQVADQNHQVEIVDQTVDIISDSGAQKDVPSLDLLAFAYGSASDSDDEQVTPELPVSKCDIGEQKLPACSDSLLHSLEPDDQDGAAEGNSHSSSKLGHRDEISACYSRQPSCYKRKRKCTSSNLTIKSQQISECSVETDREMGPEESSCLTNLRRDAGVLSGRWTTESAEFYENDVYMEQIPSGPATSIPSNSLHTVSKGSQPPSFGDTAKYDNVNVSIKNANMSFVHRSNEDSLRKHIFCLDHAVEVEKQLRPVGGAHMLLLCRSDYPNVEAEAKLLAEELGINYDWKDILFNEANQEELETIRLALDDEEALPGNGDWAVKLGVNLYYSANLSRSPLYNKQLPYNSIIYKAFGCSSPENSIAKDKLSGKASSKQKKIVLAGKWCGKVWMSNQVHPYLADRATEEENSIGFHTPATSNLRPSSRPERKVETNQPSEQLTPCLEPCSKIEREVDISHHREHVTSSSKPNPESKREAEISHQFDQPPLPDKKSSSSRVTTTITRKRGQKRKRKTVNKATRRSKFVSLGKATKATEAEDSSASDSPSQGVRISKTEQPKKPLCRGSSARKIQSGTINKPRSPSFDNTTEETEEEDSSESDSLSQGGRIHGRQRPKMTLLRSIDSRKKENTITKRPESPSVDNPIDATDSDYSSESDFPSRGGKIIRCEQLKTPLPRGSNLKNSRHCNSDSKDENEGGPSTRLRKRPSKPADVVPPKSSKKSKAAKKEKRAPIFSSNDVKDEELEYQCDVDGCTMGFNTKQELVFHKRNICSVKGCGKKFFSHKYLLQHRRVHIDDRPLKCPWKGCKMSFKWAWARTEHIRVHTGARPYACPVVGCEQTFRFVSDFSRHKRKTGHAAKR